MKEKLIDMTDRAKGIFGEIVEYASAYVDNDMDADSLSDDNSIEPKDAYPVFVKFSNEKTFIIWSSEWGGVTSFPERCFSEYTISG